jgi:hypothetical protein
LKNSFSTNLSEFKNYILLTFFSAVIAVHACCHCSVDGSIFLSSVLMGMSRFLVTAIRAILGVLPLAVNLDRRCSGWDCPLAMMRVTSCALSASITGKPEQCYWEVGLLKHTPASAIERLARTADSHTPIAHW